MPAVPAASSANQPTVNAAPTPADSLPQEQQAARVLIDLMQQEQAALIAADIDSLTMITERKTPVVAQMSELATRRHRALATLGHAASEIGMQAWIETRQPGQPTHEQAAAAWNALLAMARQAREINRINGLLISSHIARNQSALNVLRVQSGGANLYGPDGQATSRGLGRGLVAG